MLNFEQFWKCIWAEMYPRPPSPFLRFLVIPPHVCILQKKRVRMLLIGPIHRRRWRRAVGHVPPLKLTELLRLWAYWCLKKDKESALGRLYSALQLVEHLLIAQKWMVAKWLYRRSLLQYWLDALEGNFNGDPPPVYSTVASLHRRTCTGNDCLLLPGQVEAQMPAARCSMLAVAGCCWLTCAYIGLGPAHRPRRMPHKGRCAFKRLTFV